MSENFWIRVSIRVLHLLLMNTKANLVSSNLYGTHPVYLETRYQTNSASLSHGVYARNAHGQEWLLRDGNITYRTIGGSFDFYFLSGPTAKEVIAQYQGGIIGYPAMQMYWTFGYHQCRWGYQNWSVMQDVVDSYAEAGIQLETIWNDIDCTLSSFMPLGSLPSDVISRYGWIQGLY